MPPEVQEIFDRIKLEQAIKEWLRAERARERQRNKIERRF